MKTASLYVMAATIAAVAAVSGQAGPSDAKKTATPAPAQPQAAAVRPAAATAPPPPGYVIGPDDVLSVVFWRDKDMSGDVVVRPDGNITLPLLNDIPAAGLTPDQLRERIAVEARRYVEDPSPTVVVKEIHSRNVFITGLVEKPGSYPLAGPTSVLQLIAMAGGLKEFADGSKILIMRTEKGRPVAYKFDYKVVLRRLNLGQNIDLKPGDTVVVP